MKIAGRRWFQLGLGSALASLGAIGALAFWIYTSSPPADTFWSWRGYLSLASLVIGFAILAIPHKHRTTLVKGVRERTSRKYLGLFASVVVVILLALLVTAVAWTFIGFALYGKWTTDLPTDQTTRADATRLVLTITAGIGAAVALVVAYRRQSNLEEGRFLERLATAARQIGDREPIVQFSGIYALVALADEPTATGARQTARSQQCVSVLCAYLRLPYSPGAHESFVEEIVHKQTWANSQGHIEETRTYGVRPADKEIRHTIIRIIGEHLQPNTSSSWSDLSLDFKGAVFDGGDFRGAVFNGPLTDFRGAHFTGGTVDFRFAQFTGGTVGFSSAEFTGGTVDFRFAQFTGGTVDFRFAEFTGGTVDFSKAQFTGGTVDFKEVTGADPGILEFTNPVSWEVPPVVPWATGDVPSWVIPAAWPPATAP